MKLTTLLLIIMIFSGCAFQGPSLAIRPIGGASQEDLETQAQAIERAFKVVDARLRELESGKSGGKKDEK